MDLQHYSFSNVFILYLFKDMSFPSGLVKAEFFFAVSCPNFNVCNLVSNSLSSVYSSLVGTILSSKMLVNVNGLFCSDLCGTNTICSVSLGAGGSLIYLNWLKSHKFQSKYTICEVSWILCYVLECIWSLTFLDAFDLHLAICVISYPY